MSAPITKSHMAFELPKLSYIDTSWEEPVVQPDSKPARQGGISRMVSRFQAWRAASRTRAELHSMSDRELFDVGLNRGDLDRIFDHRFNQDLRSRGHLN